MTRKKNAPALDLIFNDIIPSDSRQARQLTRRQLIVEAVIQEGSLRIEDLVERFGISLMTIHRDLDELEERGLLRKGRGIVSATPTSLVEASDLYRSSRQLREKQAIAKAAVESIEPGQSLFLDDSTTVFQMARLLPGKAPLTVITNSLSLINEMKDSSDINLISLGGQYQSWCNAFLGQITRHEISMLSADLCFVSMSAIVNGQIFHQSPEMVETKKAMYDSASRRILLADHTKFEKRALYRYLALADFDLVIVDELTSESEIDKIRNQGIEVRIAKLGSLHSVHNGE